MVPALPTYGPTLSKAQCEAVPSGTSAAGFSPEQTRVLCRALGTPELGRMAADNLRAQRLFILFLAALSAGVFWNLGAWVNRTRNAQTLSEELRKRRPDNPGAGANTTHEPA